MSASVVSAIVSAVSTLILGGIAAWVRGIRNEFRRFMTEHIWLLETTKRNSSSIQVIMGKLGMLITEADRPPNMPTEPVEKHA